MAVSDLGPFDRRSRNIFASRKSWQNLNPCDYRAVLLDIPNMNRVFIQEVSGVITFLFGFGSPKISGAFEKTGPGTSEKWATSCHLNTNYIQSLG